MGLGLGLGLDLKPEVDDLFGPSDTGAAGNFGLVNNPQGWTENQQEVDRTRVLEMTAPRAGTTCPLCRWTNLPS